jgi:hypothetical protein
MKNSLVRSAGICGRAHKATPATRPAKRSAHSAWSIEHEAGTNSLAPEGVTVSVRAGLAFSCEAQFVNVFYQNALKLSIGKPGNSYLFPARYFRRFLFLQ